MTATWAILKRFLFGWTRSRSSLMGMLVLPIVFVFVFGVLPTMGKNQTPVSVVDQDHSAISRILVQRLEALPTFNVTEIQPGAVQTVLRELKASAVITLPAGLQTDLLTGRDPVVQWLDSPNAGGFGGNAGDLLTLRQTMSQWITFGSVGLRQAQASGRSTAQILAAFRVGLAQADHVVALIQTHGVSLSDGKVQTQFIQDNQRVMLGFSVMFIVFTVFGTTGSLLVERQKGTWDRMKASPTRKRSIIAGYGLGFFVMGWLQFLILYLAARLLFGIVIPMNGLVMLILSLYVLAICGIALTVVGTVKSNEQHMIIGSFVGTVSSMIGGAYWPLDIEPTWMQHLAWFVPQSWALSGFKAAVLGLTSMSSVGLPLAVLAGFALIFFTTGMIQLKYS